MSQSSKLYHTKYYSPVELMHEVFDHRTDVFSVAMIIVQMYIVKHEKGWPKTVPAFFDKNNEAISSFTL